MNVKVVINNSCCCPQAEEPVVVENTAPVITLLGNNPQVVEQWQGYIEWGATATDAEDGDITASIVTDSSAVNTDVVGVYEVTYTVTDSGGIEVTSTRTVEVVAPAINEPPVIIILGDNPTEVEQNTTYVDAGATASDVEDGDITADIITTNGVNTATVGTYYVVYEVPDSGGNIVSAIRTVNVVAPDIGFDTVIQGE